MDQPCGGKDCNEHQERAPEIADAEHKGPDNKIQVLFFKFGQERENIGGNCSPQQEDHSKKEEEESIDPAGTVSADIDVKGKKSAECRENETQRHGLFEVSFKGAEKILADIGLFPANQTNQTIIKGCGRRPDRKYRDAAKEPEHI